MTVRLVCRACGKRLKLPDGLTAARSAKCPKCLAPVDLTAALQAAAYRPTDPAARGTPSLLGRNDPLPLAPKPAITVTKPAPRPKPAPPKPPPLLGADDPLPLPAATRSVPLAQTPTPHHTPEPEIRHPAPNAEEILSLDDDPPEAAPPAEPVPFRVPVRVLADSVASSVGPCTAVLLPHGLYLEHEPMKPFLYIPPGSWVDSPAPDELTVALPDGRSVTFRFLGRVARPLARDTGAFLAGERPAPIAGDYRRKWWMMWAAVIFALGLAGGPLVLAQTAELDPEFGLQVGAGCALAGFLVNTCIVFFSRRSVPGQVLVMAGMCVLATGLFLFGATAYLAGRQRTIDEAKSDPPANQAPVAPAPDPKPPEPPPLRPPSHLDRAKKNGSSALDDGPTAVTALALAPDGNTLGIGYADGTTRVWPLDQPTFEAVLPGPKADAPVTRMQFDTTSVFVFAHTAGGVFAAPKSAPPAPSAKLRGALVAVASELDGDRVRFAAIRGNQIQHRLIGTTFLKNPPKDGKDFALPGKGDEILPPGIGKDPNKPAGPTFLAWSPVGRLYAGQPDGTINMWSTAMRAEAPSRDHKAAVRAWAECAATGDFATGDDQGNVGIWPAKGGKPTVTSALATPVAGLSFSPSGARLAITDTTGWLVIWDPVAAKAVHRVKRPTAVKAVAFGPGEDVISLAAGPTVEVWWIPELVK